MGRTTTFWHDFYFEDIEFSSDEISEFELEVHYYIENDGIGSYEYWGYKGYDAGVDYPVVENITCTDPRVTKWLENDDNFEKLATKIEEELSYD